MLLMIFCILEDNITLQEYLKNIILEWPEVDEVICIGSNEEFSVLENELSFVKKNLAVTITSFVDKSKNYMGVVSEINPMVDENGLIQVKAKVNIPDNTLFDGMNVKVIINQPIHDVIVIPKEALVLRSNKEVVFTVKEGLAKWNYVEVLDENSSSYALKKGLKLGDTIIVSGNMNLSHDARVAPIFIGEQEDSK